MILFNLKIAWRNLLKNRVFSGINIIGLALSMAACLVISMYLWSELQHDRFHKHANEIYRITEKQNQAGSLYNVAVTPGPLAPELTKDFPEIVNTVRIGSWSGVFKNGTKILKERNVLLTENSFFTLFDFPLVKGNPQSALSGIDNVVISESAAYRFFGKDWKTNTALIGQTFRYNNEKDFRLSGIVKDPPAHSSIQFDVLLPIEWLFKTDKWSFKWGSNSYHTYIQLQKGSDVKVLEKKIAHQMQVYNTESTDLLQLQALPDQYLHSRFDFDTDWGKRSSFTYIKIFSAVGILLLIIACVNFINLSTARSIKRALEVGVKKVNGATRRQLILQFLSESVLTSAIAGVMAIILINLFAPLLKSFTLNPEFLNVSHPLIIPFFIFIILVIGLLAGLYPSLFLSSFTPVKVLKSSKGIKSGKTFRQVLVVIQFTISVTLISSTFFMYEQLKFMRDKELGFDKEQLLNIRLNGKLKKDNQLFQKEVESMSSVVATARSTMSMVNVESSSYLEWDGMQEKDKFLVTHANVDPDFIPVLGLQLINGNNFQPQKSDDTSNYIVNESTVSRMGLTANNIIGKRVTFWGTPGTIIGVVKDFHFQSLAKTIEPFIFRYQPENPYFTLFVKTAPGRTADAIAGISKLYKKSEPEFPIEYSFVDEALDETYREQQKTAGIIFLFACLTIFVGCLGLFGLTVFATEQRIKEIGIRKVLGAGVTSIIRLLSADFLKLVIFATVIAIPIGLYLIRQWLQDFAYRINVDWWVFGLVGIIVLMVSLVTIGFHAVKAAMLNPVHSLRNE